MSSTIFVGDSLRLIDDLLQLPSLRTHKHTHIQKLCVEMDKSLSSTLSYWLEASCGFALSVLSEFTPAAWTIEWENVICEMQTEAHRWFDIVLT